MLATRQSLRADGYYDQTLGVHLVSVIAGQYNWTTADDIAFSTTLGSCLSVCVCDTHAKIGGMYHFLLPEAPKNDNSAYSASFRYGSAAIEGLLNALYSKGAAKNGLTIKIFGGGSVLNGISSDVGQRNIEFARRFFTRENLRITSEDVGENFGRRIIFFPSTGKVLLRKLGEQKELISIAEQEKKIISKLNPQSEEGDVELF